MYLGRPWRDYAKVVIINSYLGSHIKEEGWHDWNKAKAHETAFFGSMEIMDQALIPVKVSWAKILTKDEAKSYTRENILGQW